MLEKTIDRSLMIFVKGKNLLNNKQKDLWEELSLTVDLLITREKLTRSLDSRKSIIGVWIGFSKEFH